MEPKEESTFRRKGEDGEKKEKATDGKTSQETNSHGFDFSKLSEEQVKKFLDKSDTSDLLKHVLSMAGAVGINYFFLIKPLQDKMEGMKHKINEQIDKVEDLEDDLIKTKKELEEYKKDNKAKNNELFSINSNDTRNKTYQSYRRFDL